VEVLDAVGVPVAVGVVTVDDMVVLVRVEVIVSEVSEAVEVPVVVYVRVCVVFVAVRPVPPPHAQQTVAPEYPKFAYCSEPELQSGDLP
jgi:hypothetical protein